MQNVPYPARNCGTHHIRVPTLAADQYLNRHNQVAAQLHLDICRHYGIKVEAECWYQHKPERVMENEKATIHVALPQSSLTDMCPTTSQT